MNNQPCAKCASPDAILISEVRIISSHDSPPVPAVCASCRFYSRARDASQSIDELGACRRRAPTKQAEWFVDAYPFTNGNGWCGEYERNNGYRPKTPSDPAKPSSGSNPPGSASSV